MNKDILKARPTSASRSEASEASPLRGWTEWSWPKGGLERRVALLQEVC